MLIRSYNKTECIKGCTLFNDKSKYNYWENRTVTTDELEIVKFINSNVFKKKVNILHIGIGNSYVAENICNFKKIDGITISSNELSYANKLNINNYKAHFLNKLSRNALDKESLSKSYDLIIDANLKSFSCCEIAFNKLFNNYTSKLSINGLIITGRKGMSWSRTVKPVYTFSFTKIFYKRLKEYDGPSSNILTIEECEKLAKIYNLKLFYNAEICTFKKV